MKKLINKLSLLFYSLKKFRISKRQQFVVAVSILTIGMVATQLVTWESRIEMVVGLAALTFIISIIVQRDELKGIEYLTLNILPTMFTISVAFFYFLLPVRWLTRVPTAFLYSLGMYAIFLTENIYNVAAIRSIQLLRAAHSVGFLITLVSIFLLFDTILSFHLAYYLNFCLVFIVVFPLSFQSLWSMTLEQKLTSKTLIPSILSSLVVSQAAFILSFWPINTTIYALFLTTIFYSLVGIIQQNLIDRLFSNMVREFLGVVLITFLLVLITAHWGG